MLRSLYRKYIIHSTIIRGSFWLGSEKIFLAAKGLILSLLLANLIQKDVYGGYQYLLALVSFFGVFAVPGMGTAIVRALAHNRPGTYAQALRAIITWSIIGSIGLLILAIYNVITKQAALNPSLLALAIIFPLLNIAPTWRYVYLGKEKYATISKITFLMEGLTFFTTIIAIYFFPEIHWLLLGSLGVNVIASLVVISPLLRESIESHKKSDDDIVYGKNLSISYGVVTASGFIDKILIGHFLGFTDVALYSVALMIPEQLRSILSVSNTVLLPHFSKSKNTATTKMTILRMMGWACFGLTVCTGIYILVSPFIFRIFFPNYVNAIHYNQVLAIGIIFVPLQVLDSFFRGQRSEHMILRSTTATSIGSFILAIILIPFFGLWGAVITRIGAAMINGLVLLGLFIYDKRALTKP